MLRYDTGTGDILPNDSGNLELISTEQAVQNANLVNPAYDYDPATRFANMQYQQPMGYYQQQPYVPYPQPNPYFQQPQMSGFGMYQGQGFQGYYGNPVFAMQGQHGFNPYFPQVPQDQVYYIPGFSPSGDTIFPPDVEETVFQLQLEMEAELEASYKERMQKANQFYQRSGYNYFGMAPVSYNDPMIVNKYKEKVQEIINQATKKRQELNYQLSRIAHGYNGEEISDAQLEEIYSPREIRVKGAVVQDMREQEYLSQFKPYNNAYMYQQAFAQVAAEQSKYFPENCDLYDFFEIAGRILCDTAMEKERQRRKEGGNLYAQDGSYSALIRQKLLERNNKDSGVIGGGNSTPNVPTQPIDQVSMSFGSPVNIPGMPTLSNSGRLFEDGTLEITPPPGLGIGSSPVVIHNQHEDGYEESRKAFIESIYMDNPKPGGAG